MRRYPRTIPEPTLVPYEDYKTIFVLTIPIDGPGSSYEAERRSLPLEGFGSMLCFDYLDLAKSRAAAFIAEGGWKLSSDLTDVRGVRMIIFKDAAGGTTSAHGTTAGQTPQH